MDEFVNIGLARQLEDNPDGYDYLVIFRQIKKELLEYFVENRKKAFAKGPKAKQLNLFEAKAVPNTGE
jgi:predicted transcriptional regulator